VCYEGVLHAPPYAKDAAVRFGTDFLLVFLLPVALIVLELHSLGPRKMVSAAVRIGIWCRAQAAREGKLNNMAAASEMSPPGSYAELSS
jgi:hypothetical protein